MFLGILGSKHFHFSELGGSGLRLKGFHDLKDFLMLLAFFAYLHTFLFENESCFKMKLMNVDGSGLRLVDSDSYARA